MLQEWEGYVTEIKDTEFAARLTDLTSGAKYAGEEACIPLEEISDDDADKMQVGSIFRWVIGYECKGRAKKRVSRPSRDHEVRHARCAGMGTKHCSGIPAMTMPETR